MGPVAPCSPPQAARSRSRFSSSDIAPFFDNWFVRATGNMPVMLYSLGIPPQQFSAMETETPGGLVGMYRERVKRLACDFPISENYFGWQAFGRSYDRASRLRDARISQGGKFPDAAGQSRPRLGAPTPR